MRVTATAIPDVLIIEPAVFSDARGFFLESYNQKSFAEATSLRLAFVQDNDSRSSQGALHGLHYQVRQTQGKLVRVASGAVFDVAVDIRKTSPSFGQSVCVELTGSNHRQIWIPPGFAHGFLVLSDTAHVLYKVTDYYAPEFERCIAWDDQELAIQWPLTDTPFLSAKDRAGSRLRDAEVFI
jgi:dTDP-4-dehydrorhamnose 3,5-epimerase